MEINITVSGKRRSCKSKMTYLIKTLLKSNGYKVNFIGDDGNTDEASFDLKCQEFLHLMAEVSGSITVNIKCGTI